MKKSLSKSFILAAIILVAVLLTASVALLFVPNDGLSTLPVDSDANAAITAASAFGRFSNGIQYYYSPTSTANTQNTITVVATDTYGSQKNPYVIETIQQWQLFINKINANDANFNAANKYFVLNADLNFNNETINPVGATTNGFKGVLCGNKHIIKSAKFGAVTDPQATSRRAAGLFYFINGGVVYDLTIDSSCTYSYALNLGTYVGGITTYATNTTLCNVANLANITVNNSGVTTGNVPIWAGGLIGNCLGGYVRVYKSVYQGTITGTASNDTSLTVATDYTDNFLHYGGVAATMNGCTEFTVAQTYIKGVVNAKHGGVNSAAILGGGNSRSGTLTYKFSDIVANWDINISGITNSPDTRLLVYNSGSISDASTYANLYIASNKTYSYVITVGNNPSPGTYSNITSNQAFAERTTATADAAATVNAAASNSNFNSIFNVSGGSATSKLNSSFNIQYDLAGGSWSPASAKTTSYTKSASAQSGKFASLATNPSKPGYTFSKWSLDSAGSSTITNSYSIPANQSGHITVYAIWTLNALSGDASGATVTYGNDATLSASSVTVPNAGTAAITGVTYSYHALAYFQGVRYAWVGLRHLLHN